MVYYYSAKYWTMLIKSSSLDSEYLHTNIYLNWTRHTGNLFVKKKTLCRCALYWCIHSSNLNLKFPYQYSSSIGPLWFVYCCKRKSSILRKISQRVRSGLVEGFEIYLWRDSNFPSNILCMTANDSLDVRHDAPSYWNHVGVINPSNSCSCRKKQSRNIVL